MQTTFDDSVALGIARSFAAQLMGHYGFGPDDIEDLTQELLFEHQRRLPKYDPRRSGPATFARLVMRNHVRSIIESRCAQRRDYKRCSQLLDEDEPARGAEKKYGHSVEGLTNLQIDVARAIGTLRPDLAQLADRLKRHSITEIARASRQPRCSIYRKLAKLRYLFEIAGLRPFGSQLRPSKNPLSNRLGGSNAQR